MKTISKKKLTVVILSVLVFSVFITTAVFAEGAFKNLKAWYGDIKIFSNNQQVQMDVKPFIVDGTTYVPLRALSNILNKNVGWDQANLRIDINDKPDSYAANMAYLSQQLVERQIKINELEAKVKQLEAELAKSSTNSLDDMEKYLNKQYGTYEKIKFDIDLKGNKDDIEVRIYVDLYDYSTKWKNLSTTKIKGYIKDIVDDILYELKNAKVTGFIEDSDSRKELVDFYLNTKGSLVVDIKNSNTYDLEDLEDELNDVYYKYKGVYFDIFLSGDKYDIIVDIDAFNDDIDELSTSDIKKYLENICDEIFYYYPDADIEGYIGDYYESYYFYVDYSGKIVLK